MQCTEERKVDLAAFLLQQGAENIWILEENKIGIVCWEEFKEIFNRKYFSNTYPEVRREEFRNLEQGKLMVVEHEKKFIKLVKYGLVLVATGRKRCERFEHRLRSEIRTPIMVIEMCCDYAKLEEAALRVIMYLFALVIIHLILR